MTRQLIVKRNFFTKNVVFKTKSVKVIIDRWINEGKNSIWIAILEIRFTQFLSVKFLNYWILPINNQFSLNSATSILKTKLQFYFISKAVLKIFEFDEVRKKNRIKYFCGKWILAKTRNALSFFAFLRWFLWYAQQVRILTKSYWWNADFAKYWWLMTSL